MNPRHIKRSNIKGIESGSSQKKDLRNLSLGSPGLPTVPISKVDPWVFQNIRECNSKVKEGVFTRKNILPVSPGRRSNPPKTAFKFKIATNSTLKSIESSIQKKGQTPEIVQIWFASDFGANKRTWKRHQSWEKFELKRKKKKGISNRTTDDKDRLIQQKGEILRKRNARVVFARRGPCIRLNGVHPNLATSQALCLAIFRLSYTTVQYHTR